MGTQRVDRLRIESLEEVALQPKVLVPALIVQQRRDPPLPRCMAYNASWSMRHRRGSVAPMGPAHIDGKPEVMQHTVSKCPSFTGRMGGTGHGALKSDEARSRKSTQIGGNRAKSAESCTAENSEQDTQSK
jgi:hypothetical protein